MVVTFIWRKRTMLVWDYSCFGFVDLKLRHNGLKQNKAAYAVEEARTKIYTFLYPARGGLLKSIYPTTSIPPSLCSVTETRGKRGGGSHSMEGELSVILKLYNFREID